MELALKVALPLLLVGLAVGLIISVFQAVTQIQEQTLTFIPKILATVVVMVVGGPWMLDHLADVADRHRAQRWRLLHRHHEAAFVFLAKAGFLLVAGKGKWARRYDEGEEAQAQKVAEKRGDLHGFAKA